MPKKLDTGKTNTTIATDVSKYIDKITCGDCISIMNEMPPNSVDLIFADPPYNLQLSQDLYRTGNNTKVEGCNEDWDKFVDFKDYDKFTKNWLAACRRVLKPDGTIWVIGSFHNIFRVGTILQDLEYWILNDVIWVKLNPMPNFLGKRLTNAHETLIWASKNQNSKYTFNYEALKSFNEDKQLRSDWKFPVCSGGERLKLITGEKVHPTQKPESLLHRILVASSKSGDIILDPFFGTGTTGAVAKKLGRHFIGIEREQKYYVEAQSRIDRIRFGEGKFLQLQKKKKEEVRIPFGSLVESGVIKPGTFLTDRKGRNSSLVRIDGSLEFNGQTGSIHKIGAVVQGMDKCNGWTFWHIEKNGELVIIDQFREEARKDLDKDIESSDNTAKSSVFKSSAKSGNIKMTRNSSEKTRLNHKNTIAKNKRGRPPIKNSQTTLFNESQVREIKKAHKRGESASGLAKRYNTSNQTIYNVVNGLKAYAQF